MLAKHANALETKNEKLGQCFECHRPLFRKGYGAHFQSQHPETYARLAPLYPNLNVCDWPEAQAEKPTRHTNGNGNGDHYAETPQATPRPPFQPPLASSPAPPPPPDRRTIATNSIRQILTKSGLSTIDALTILTELAAERLRAVAARNPDAELYQ